MSADAIARWSQSLARDPSSLAFLPLADALRRQRQLDDALAVALRGLERHPYLADAHDLLARVSMDRADEQRAHDEWEMALRLDPRHLPSLKGLGFLAFRRHDVATAARLLGIAREIDPADPGLEAAWRRVQAALDEAGTTHRNGQVSPDVTVPMANGAGTDTRHGHAHGAANGTTGSTPLAAPAVARAAEGARTLFAPLLGEAEGTALLLDRDGLVIAGSYVDEDGREIGDEIGAQLAGLADEAARALAHLGLGEWERLMVEAPHATVAMAPAVDHAIVLVAAAGDTQVGFVRRLLDRARRRATTWLEAST